MKKNEKNDDQQKNSRIFKKKNKIPKNTFKHHKKSDSKKFRVEF